LFERVEQSQRHMPVTQRREFNIVAVATVAFSLTGRGGGGGSGSSGSAQPGAPARVIEENRRINPQ
jgi:hypothetical protein